MAIETIFLHLLPSLESTGSQVLVQIFGQTYIGHREKMIKDFLQGYPGFEQHCRRGYFDPHIKVKTEDVPQSLLWASHFRASYPIDAPRRPRCAESACSLKAFFSGLSAWAWSGVIQAWP
ncbi:hypothetical protein COL516b_006804 [Colletotrichum fioriniae]|nr:uncharacterized protein COL516b_006804 [Colletotrichum fioriniae]KAJ0302767.1 hypothetical protein COL516b_006804 [Colletotrichum fioriniae]